MRNGRIEAHRGSKNSTLLYDGAFAERWSRSSTYCWRETLRVITTTDASAVSTAILSCFCSSIVLGSSTWIVYITPSCSHHKFAAAQEPPQETGLNIPTMPFFNLAGFVFGSSPKTSVEPENIAAKLALLPSSS